MSTGYLSAYLYRTLTALMLVGITWVAGDTTPAFCEEEALRLAGSSPRVGILVMAHGGSAEWNRAVEGAVAPLRTFCPVAIAFGMANPRTLQTAVSQLEAQGVQRIVVVRLFVSPNSFLHRTEYLLGLRSDAPPSASRLRPIQRRAEIVLSREGLYEASLVGDILAQRAKALSERPAQESVLLIAHGAGDDVENARWLVAMERQAEKVRALGFYSVRVETLREDWPEERAMAERRLRAFVKAETLAGRRVLVIPFRVYGFGPYRRVLQGLDYVADGRGFLPHPRITDWMRQQAERCLRRVGWANPFSQDRSSAGRGETGG